MNPRRWWHDTVGYEVYIRSFADSSGDGNGDLVGLRSRLDYLAWLGIGVVWVTPFFPSPMCDHGYDVADYTDVDPRFGELADFDALVAEAHLRGIRVLVDLVPNHTSSVHRWFAESRSSRDNPYRDYYIWRDPGPDGGPPNNWSSHFGGPAWTFDAATGQYWLHLFLPEQPDLNWRNPAVVDEFDRILEFWLDRGAGGFRIDVAHGLVKHEDLLDLPLAPPGHPDEEGPSPTTEHARFEHVYDVDQPEVLDIYRRWRALADARDAVLLGEVYLLDADRLARYLVDGDGLHLSFWFGVAHAPWDADRLRTALRDGAACATGSVSWIQASHDRSRPPTRFGGGDRGRARALALSTLLFGLPGTPFLYQGEELGLTDGELEPEDVQDPVAVHVGDVTLGRDPCRTPMPWAPGQGLGFTTADAPWLPFGNREPAESASVQQGCEDSWLQRYRALIAMRAAITAADEHIEWTTEQGPVIAYRRGHVWVGANCGTEEVAGPVPAGTWRVAFATEYAREGEVVTEGIRLRPAEAVILLAH